MTRKEQAMTYFKAGYNCAQAVFLTFSDLTGFDEKTALHISAPFGGGFGRQREVCGAVSGAAMALGSVVAATDGSDAESKQKNYELVREFADRFKGLPADQEWELIKLYDRYIEALKKDWSTRYTYCSGCFKDVRRDNTYTELTKDGKLLIKCKSCNTIWYVKDAE